MASFHQLIVTESKWQCIVNVDSQNAKCERQQTPSTKTSINTKNETLNLLTYVEFANDLIISKEFPKSIEIDDGTKKLFIEYNKKHGKPKIKKVRRLPPKNQKIWTLQITFIINATLDYTFQDPGRNGARMKRQEHQNNMLNDRLREYSKRIYDRIEPTKKK